MTEALAGRRAVQKLTDSRLYQKSRLVLSVPLYLDGEVAGVVMGSFSDESVQEILVSSAFDGCAYSFLSDTSGQIVVNAEAPLLLQGTDNLFDKFANMELLEGTTVSGMLTDLQNGDSGVAVYGIGGEKRYAVYQPTGINDWYIFNVVPDTVVSRTINAQNRLGILCIGIVSVSAVLLLVIMAFRERRRVRDLKCMQEEQLIRYRTDPVTGLLNTMGFTHAVEETLKSLPEEKFCAIVDFSILNLNYFNVSYGSPTGEAMLRDTAQTLLAHCRVKQPCARLSDDRFACIITDCETCEELVERIRLLDAALHASDGTHQLLMAYGVYAVEDRTLSAEELCTRAVAARLRISAQEHNIGVYDNELHCRQMEDAMLVSKMEEGLQREEFVPYYQPKYDANTEKIVGAEALVRWIRADGEVRPPDRFIRLFESNGLITKLDLYMFEHVCKKLASMARPVQISVNFSRVHLYDKNFPEKLAEIAGRYGVSKSMLEIELTETAFFDQRDVLIENMNRLREQGFLVSMDDFGSGYSSLNLLKDVYFDIIKIDKGFLAETTQSERGKRVIQSVLALADALQVHTVAEGVETAEQLAFLRENGCDIIQGFYFSRPVPEAEFDRLLRERSDQ